MRIEGERVTHHIQRNTGKKNRFFGKYHAEDKEQSLKKLKRKKSNSLEIKEQSWRTKLPGFKNYPTDKILKTNWY